jgi:hypothetical protein
MLVMVWVETNLKLEENFFFKKWCLRKITHLRWIPEKFKAPTHAQNFLFEELWTAAGLWKENFNIETEKKIAKNYMS